MSLDGRRYYEGSKTPENQNSQASYKNVKAQNSPSSLGDGVSPSSQSPGSAKNHDYEGEHSPIKKSVFTKVKEKAKKLRHSLSNRSRRHHEIESSGNATPPWGVSLEDNDDHEEPEYLGAPMYESEVAPEKLKETTKEKLQEVHVPSEKHVVESTVKNEAIKEESQTPNKTINNTSSQNMAPTSAQDATGSTSADIAGLTINTTTIEDPKDSYDMSVINTEASEAGKLGQGQGTSQHTWDKGVSVKEYLMQKLEPGEDEKALSQVITETMSPRKSSGEMGMMEKMKEAVNSFLQSDNADSISTTKTTNDPNSAHTDKNISTNTIKTIPFDTVNMNSSANDSNSSALNPISNVTELNTSSGTNATSGTVNMNSSANDSNSAADLNPSAYVPPINTNPNQVNDGEKHGRTPSSN